MSECKHEPGPMTSFARPCKHCGEPLEAVPCDPCDGIGELIACRKAWETCQQCNGSGVKEWRLA